MTVTVYEITCVPTGKKYVGITRKTAAQRLVEHKKEARQKRFDTVFYRAMRAHGPENFTVEVLREVETPMEAQHLERELIVSRNTMAPNGMNTSTGGELLAGIAKHPDVIAKISASKKGVAVHTAEGKRRMSELRRGRKVSDAQLAGIRAANNRPGRRKEISEQSSARWQDPEYRSARLAELAKNRANPENKARRLAGIQRAKAEGKYLARVYDPAMFAARGAKLKGRRQSPEHVQKVKAALTGKKRTTEQTARNKAVQVDAVWGIKGETHGPAALDVRSLVDLLDNTAYPRHHERPRQGELSLTMGAV